MIMWLVSVASTKLQFQRARIKWYLDLPFCLHLLSHAWHTENVGLFLVSTFLNGLKPSCIILTHMTREDLAGLLSITDNMVAKSFWLCWVFIAMHGLSLVAAFRGFSSFGMQASLNCSAQSLECAWSQYLWHGLSCLMACRILVPWPGMNSSPLRWKADS